MSSSGFMAAARGPCRSASPTPTSRGGGASASRAGLASTRRPALELAGRAEAAYGLQEAMAWADAGNEVFVISQLGHTRSIITALREKLGPAALTPEDNMLLEAQGSLGFKVVSGAATSYLDDGLTGLMDYGKKQAVSNATTAVTYNVDKTFHTRARVGVAVTFEGTSGTRYAVRDTPYKPRDHDASIRFKRARWKSYQMMRTR